MNKFTKQCVAAFASLAMAGTLCVAGAVVANTSAWADTQTACTANKAPWATDQTKNCVGSILIHKTDDAANPNGLNGVTFTIKKVAKLAPSTETNAKDLDLKDKDAWVTLASKVGELNAAAQAGNPESKVTFDTTFNTSGSKSDTTKDGTWEGTANTKGVASFTNLPLGLYYVAETGVTGDAAGYSPKFSPFFITVPEITRGKSATNNTYNYTVKVSPKNWNATEGIKKDAVTGDIVGVGDTLPYKITAKVTLPADADKTSESTGGTKVEYFAGSNIKGFKIWDDALIAAYEGIEKTDYTPEATVTVGEYDASGTSFKAGTNENPNPETLNKTDDYTVTVTDSEVDKGTAATRKRILFDFTEAGKNKIAKKFGTNANTDIRVQVTLKFKLKSTYGSAAAETVLENKYGFNPGGKGGNTPDITGTTTKTNLHKFHIFKYDGTTENSGTKKPLSQAQFKVFTDSTKADTCAKNPDGNGACTGAMTGFVDPQNATAGETGTIATTGKDGKTADYVAKEGEKFYVVEIKAPDGFARSEKVYDVTVPATADGQTAAVYEYAIANVPSNDGDFWFKLPKTGAAGVTIFAIAGMGLVGIGIFVFMRNRKKDEEHQNA